jgi:hypothetical protein
VSEVYSLHKVNKAPSKCQRAKRSPGAAWRIAYCARGTDYTRPEGLGGREGAQGTHPDGSSAVGSLRRLGALICTASLAIMYVLGSRLQNHLDQLFQ